MKKLITIILLFGSAYGQHYFVIPTMNSAENKARFVSRKFYQLSRPSQGQDVTMYLFGYIKHPLNDSVALVLDTAFNLPKGAINATRITEWINETYPTITTTQRNTLTNYINANNILRISRLILTARLKLWTYQEMANRGWFNYGL